MAAPLRVLIVEDSEADVALLLRELSRGGFEPDFSHVDTADSMRAALVSREWDLVISDYSLPGFGGLAALKLLRDTKLDLPFILVSGTIGEDIAVEAMRAGVSDYLMKGKLQRLVPAVQRELKEAKARAAHREAQKALLALEKAVESLPVGVTIAGMDGRILYTNPAEGRLHGYERDELLGQQARILVPPELCKSLTPDQMRNLRTWKRETLNVRKDNSTFPAQLISDVIKDGSGEPLGIVTICEDISERKLAEEQLFRHAFYDMLTGLANRKLFSDRLGRAVERAKRRDDYLFAVLFLDLDRFKLVNDSFGHGVGDELLVAIARRLEHCLRPGDSVARHGGDEFTILVEDIKGVSGATQVAERIRAELAAPFLLGGRDVFASASIGIAMGTAAPHQRPEDLLRDADTAMYRAKALGKARYEVFDTAMHEHAVSLLQLETDLRRAIDRGDIAVYYEPIVCLQSGTITGLEALARWPHPERGLVLPEEFIPLAEETGLILPLGRLVLHEACRQLRELHTRLDGGEPRLTISVNLSASQLTQADLLDQIDRVVAETGVDPGCLKLEITESVIMANADAATATLLKLKDRGIQIRLDDFGTGYSSLSYLQRLPVDTLKIDRSFVARMGAAGEKAEIVHSIVTLARSLGMEVMAEGVETTYQLARLRQLTCDAAQGWFFSKPLPAREIGDLIAARPRW